MKKEKVDVSITGNSTNPTRFQHLVAGTYKKWAYENNKEYLGTVQKVLVEGPSKNNDKMLTGRTESSKIVVFEGNEDLINTIQNVKITEDHMWYFKGEKE